MKISIRSGGARWFLLIVVAYISGALGYVAGRMFLAEHWANSAAPEKWLKAALLEPGNGEFWYRLGRFRQLDFAQGDLKRAAEYYRRATSVDPRSADYWMDLGSAYEEAGEIEQAERAFGAAQAAYPISAEVAWRYGNFLLRQGRLDDAFAQIHRALASDPKLAALAMSRCWRSSQEIERILDIALPASGEVYWPAMESLVREREIDAALAVWNRLVALRPPFAARRAWDLIELLLWGERWDESRRVWQEALAMAGLASSGPPGPSLVWDGGFEGDFLNGGFGWWQKDVDGADVDFDIDVHHGGARSVRVSFDGSTNVEFEHVFQFVLVEPNTRYRFSAYLRTESISTDHGIQLWVFDARHPADAAIRTPMGVGTQDWVLDEADITTGPHTHLLKIILFRLHSDKFDNKIRGTVWVDDVSLTPVLDQKAPAPR